MKYSYYPGCTLRTKAKDLDEYARASAAALGFELEEIEDWQCCGGVYPLGTDEIATKLSSVRALNQAKEKGQDLVTICSACHHVIIGTRGRITVPNDWWNTGYFEAKVEGQEFLKRYSFNFEGNGLRYLLQELMIMIRDRRTECTRFFYEESETLAELLKIIDQRG